VPLKAPRTRAPAGEQRTPGEVRPVTTRSIVGISVALVLVVVIAITALIWASGSPKTTVDTSNTPSLTPGSAGPATSTATYRETVELPSGSDRSQVVPAQLALQCSGVCRGGTLQGYLGTFTLTTIFGATTTLTGTLDGSCETITLTPQDELSGAPQILTGTITRPDSCTSTTTTVAVPITVRLDRT
jgi:hypothetical protein